MHISEVLSFLLVFNHSFKLPLRVAWIRRISPKYMGGETQLVRLETDVGSLRECGETLFA